MHKTRTTFRMIKTTLYRPALGLAASNPREKCLGLTSCYPDELDDKMAGFQPSLLSKEKETPDADEEKFD